MSPSIFLFMTVIMIALIEVQAQHKVTYTVHFINSDDSTATHTYVQNYNDTDVQRGDLLVKTKALSLINTKVPNFGFTFSSIIVCDVVKDGNGILSATITLKVAAGLPNVN